ncbi:MAG: uracil phosphoribosyltransferase [Flavobacteriales bacterium]|nr:uracil phosphoribosyltransferase [Flavobacteriales bacterium]
MIHDLSLSNSVLNNFVGEVRDAKIQSDRLRFRRNMERIGEIMAYEISKQLEYEEVEVRTPLALKHMSKTRDQVVLATILRAGLPFHQGFLNYFDGADNAFVSAYRKYLSAEDFEIEVEYISCPDLTDKTLILVDPMIATGASLVKSYEALLRRGVPRKVVFAGVIASRQGIDFVKKRIPGSVELWVAAVDPDLTAKSYIIPGLGDAGDLAYGIKD